MRVAHAKGWRVAVAGACERGARGLRVDRLQVDVPRRRGGHPAGDVLARRAARSARCASRSRGSRSRAIASRCCRPRDADEPLRAQAAARSPRSGAATGRSAASRWRWTRSSATRTPCSRSPRARRPRRRVPAARPVAGQRGLLARVDAPPRRHAERADGVPDHRDGRVGAAARGHRGVAQLLRSSPTSCVPATTRRALRARCAGCSSRATGCSSSSACTASTASSSPTGGAATSASSGGPTCRSPGSRTCTRSRCSCRPARGSAPTTWRRSEGRTRRASSSCSCSRRAPLRRSDALARRARRAFQRSGLRDHGAGRARESLRRRAGGLHPRALGRDDPVDAVPRHPLAGAERRRAGAVVGGVRPGVPEVASLLRRLHRPQRRHACRRVPVERNARDSRRRRSSASS